jgi:hypothetical protein
MIRTVSISKPASVWSWMVAAAAATLLGPVFYGCVLALERGEGLVDTLGYGLATILPAVMFLPHVLLVIWVFSAVAGLALAKLRLANSAIFSALGVAVGLAFFFTVFDNPYIGDEEQRRRIAAYFAIAGMLDGFVYWGVIKLLSRRSDASTKSPAS